MTASDLDHPFELRPLEKEKGGGWLIVFSDLPGCMSGRETAEEAIASGVLYPVRPGERLRLDSVGLDVPIEAVYEDVD